MWSRGAIGGPFQLTDSAGTRRSLAEFRGKIVALYFGYTFCPDICPTDLVAIARAIELLGAKGDDIQPVFISVDPERDTPKLIGEYVNSISPRLVGLTGTPDEIRAVADSYKVYFEKTGGAEGASYLIDHSAVIYFIGREGNYMGYAPPQTSPERLADILRQLHSQK